MTGKTPGDWVRTGNRKDGTPVWHQIIQGPHRAEHAEQKDDETRQVVTVRCPDCNGHIDFNADQLTPKFNTSGEGRSGDVNKNYRYHTIKGHEKTLVHRKALESGLCAPCDEGTIMLGCRTEIFPFHLRFRLPLTTEDVVPVLMELCDTMVGRFVPTLEPRRCIAVREPHESHLAIRLHWPDVIVDDAKDTSKFKLMRESSLYACMAHEWKGALVNAEYKEAWESAILGSGRVQLPLGEVLYATTSGMTDDDLVAALLGDSERLEAVVKVQCAHDTQCSPEWEIFNGCPSTSAKPPEPMPRKQKAFKWETKALTKAQTTAVRALLARFDPKDNMYANAVLNVMFKYPIAKKPCDQPKVRATEVIVDLAGLGSTFCLLNRCSHMEHTIRVHIRHWPKTPTGDLHARLIVCPICMNGASVEQKEVYMATLAEHGRSSEGISYSNVQREHLVETLTRDEKIELCLAPRPKRKTAEDNRLAADEEESAINKLIEDYYTTETRRQEAREKADHDRERAKKGISEPKPAKKELEAPSKGKRPMVLPADLVSLGEASKRPRA